MSAVSVKAHFDGNAIQLDEPCDLPRDIPLWVTVIPSDAVNSDMAGWTDFAKRELARAYGENEPEYSEADLLI